MGIADVRIYNSAGQIFDLQDPDTYMIGEDNNIGVSVEDITFTKVGMRNYDVPHVIGTPNREIGLNVYITGTSIDNLITKFRNLEDIFAQTLKYYDEDGRAGAKAWVQFKLDSGSYVTEYDILNGVIDGSSILESTDEMITIMMPVTLTVKTPAHAQANLSTESAAMDNGDTFLISAPIGDIDSPAKVSLQMLSGGSNLTEFFIGKKSRGDVNNFIFPFEAETGTYTGYTSADGGFFAASNQVNIAAHGGNIRRVTLAAGGSEKVLMWTITDNLKDFYGKYFVFVRSTSLNAGLTNAQLRYGGPNGNRIVDTAITAPVAAATNELWLLGSMQIPEEDYPLSEPTEFRFSLYADGSGAGTWDIDCIYLMPIDEEYIRWQSDTDFVNNERLVSNNIDTPYRVYPLESDGDLQSDNPLTPIHDSHFTVVHGEDQKFCWLAYNKSTTNPTHNLTNKGKLIVEYQELYSLLK